MSRTKYVRIKAIPFGLAFSFLNFPKSCHYSSTHSETVEHYCTDNICIASVAIGVLQLVSPISTNTFPIFLAISIAS